MLCLPFEPSLLRRVKVERLVGLHRGLHASVVSFLLPHSRFWLLLCFQVHESVELLMKCRRGWLFSEIQNLLLAKALVPVDVLHFHQLFSVHRALDELQIGFALFLDLEQPVVLFRLQLSPSLHLIYGLLYSVIFVALRNVFFVIP